MSIGNRYAVRLGRRPVVRSFALVSLGLALLLAASCGGDGGATTTTSDATTTTGAEDTSTTIPAASTTSSSTTTTFPGEVIDLGFPKAGDVLSVVAVAYNDVLNVRVAPGTDQEVLLKLGPLADDLVATGQARQLSSSIWYEVRVDGVKGWVGSYYTAYFGSVDDLTYRVIQELGGSTPEAPTMLDLGRIAAEALASEEPRSRIVVTVAPSVGDLGEVTYDVIGLGDDSVRGYRLHVFGEGLGAGGGFYLKSVEARVLCARGVTAGGL